MSYLNEIILWIIAFCYAVLYIYDDLIQAYRFGRTQINIRLRRHVADSFFLLIIVVAGLCYEIAIGGRISTIIVLGLLVIFICICGLRYPKWRLKKEGFIAYRRYHPYESIVQIRLSEDGVLVITFADQKKIFLPIASIQDLEKSAQFLVEHQVN